MGAESFGFVGTVAHGNSTAHHLENTYSFFKDIDMKRAEESSALIRRAHQLHPLEFRLGHRATPVKLSRPNRRLQPHHLAAHHILIVSPRREPQLVGLDPQVLAYRTVADRVPAYARAPRRRGACGAGRNAVDQLAALTIGARLAVA